MPGKSGSGSGGGNFGSLRSGGNGGSGGCGMGGCESGFAEGGNPNPASRKFCMKCLMGRGDQLKELGRRHNTANPAGNQKLSKDISRQSAKKKKQENTSSTKVNTRRNE